MTTFLAVLVPLAGAAAACWLTLRIPRWAMLLIAAAFLCGAWMPVRYHAGIADMMFLQAGFTGWCAAAWHLLRPHRSTAPAKGRSI